MIVSKDHIRSEYERARNTLGLEHHEETCAIVAASMGVDELTVHEIVTEAEDAS